MSRSLLNELYADWNFDAIYYDPMLQNSLQQDSSKYAKSLSDIVIEPHDCLFEVNTVSAKV